MLVKQKKRMVEKYFITSNELKNYVTIINSGYEIENKVTVFKKFLLLQLLLLFCLHIFLMIK